MMALRHWDPLYGFDDLLDSRRAMLPYWNRHSLLDAHNIGSAIGEVTDNATEFKVAIDVSHFHPEELKVRVHNQEVVIEGHHEERTDQHGRIQRNFVRKYHLPKGAKAEDVVSHLDRDGVLTVRVPKESHTAVEGGRMVPIQAEPRAEHKTNGKAVAKK